MDVFDFLHCSEVIDGVLLVGRVMMFVALYTLYAVLILVNISLFVACLVYSMCTVFLVMHGAGWMNGWMLMYKQISILCIPFMFCHI